MTPRPGEHVRPLLGAYVLGHLGDDDAAAVTAHLEGCPSCREEAAELAPVASLLPLAAPQTVGGPAAGPPAMLDGVFAGIERERRERGRARRHTLGARVGIAAAAAALVVIVSMVALRPWEPSDPGGEVVALVASDPGVLGEAVIHEDPRSTWVELTTSGLSVGETYAVWLEETGSGERSPMGTFTSVDGDLYISLYSTLPRDRAVSIGVSDPDGSVVMRGSIPEGTSS